MSLVSTASVQPPLARLATPGSWSRVVWLWLGSSVTLLVPWLVVFLGAFTWGGDFVAPEFGLIAIPLYLAGLVWILVSNFVVWATAGRAIDARAARPWAWHLGTGAAIGAVLVLLCQAAWPFNVFVALVGVALAFVLGPLLANNALRSRVWRAVILVVAGLTLVPVVALVVSVFNR